MTLLVPVAQNQHNQMHCKEKLYLWQASVLQLQGQIVQSVLCTAEPAQDHTGAAVICSLFPGHL